VKPDDFRNGGKHGTAELSGTFSLFFPFFFRFSLIAQHTKKVFHEHEEPEKAQDAHTQE
jgi:hypothetical protein